MPRYIDADRLINRIFPMGLVDDGRYSINTKAIKHAIDETPTADVVEVVRCRDCEWWEARTYGSYVGKCQNPINGLVSEYCDDEDFCSYGKRGEQG